MDQKKKMISNGIHDEERKTSTDVALQQFSSCTYRVQRRQHEKRHGI